jgi:hypothetical protein
MNLMLSLRRCAVVITVLSGFPFPALAGESRPFKGLAHESLSAQPVPVDDGLFLIADGAGRATHVGSFTRHAEVVLHDDGTFDGEVFFTAANGDVLRAALTGSLGQDGLLAGVYTFTGAGTGSTGRFADASGSATFTGPFDGINAVLSIDGKIKY